MMVRRDKERWDQKHATTHDESEPSFLLEWIFLHGPSRISPGKALDVATGKGRHAQFLAERGFAVEAIDISEAALEEGRRQAEEKGLSISFRQADLDLCELPEATFDLILNINFLQRSLIPKMKKALKLGGYIVFETYLIDQRIIGHPKNPDYLLGHNELLELFRDLRILYYREGRFSEKGKDAYRAGLFGQKVC
jgi:2-polyprenyl-3-methyl-5-hydroxy-6-metoxy-1,4-benzoquinol methylase